jgi:hypothetical protein
VLTTPNAQDLAAMRAYRAQNRGKPLLAVFGDWDVRRRFFRFAEELGLSDDESRRLIQQLYRELGAARADQFAVGQYNAALEGADAEKNRRNVPFVRYFWESRQALDGEDYRSMARILRLEPRISLHDLFFDFGVVRGDHQRHLALLAPQLGVAERQLTARWQEEETVLASVRASDLAHAATVAKGFLAGAFHAKDEKKEPSVRKQWMWIVCWGVILGLVIVIDRAGFSFNYLFGAIGAIFVLWVLVNLLHSSVTLNPKFLVTPGEIRPNIAAPGRLTFLNPEFWVGTTDDGRTNEVTVTRAYHWGKWAWMACAAAVLFFVFAMLYSTMVASPAKTPASWEGQNSFTPRGVYEKPFSDAEKK